MRNIDVSSTTYQQTHKGLGSYLFTARFATTFRMDDTPFTVTGVAVHDGHDEVALEMLYTVGEGGAAQEYQDQ